MSTQRYRFGAFTLNEGRASLHRSGQALALRPKCFDLLVYLVTHPGRVLTKDELLAAIWPRLVVTEDSLIRCVSEIRATLGAEGAPWLKTVPRRGYLFDVAVTALADEEEEAHEQTALSPPSPPAPGRFEHRRGIGIAVVAALLLTLSVSYWFWSPRKSPIAPRLSLVVVPFVAMGTANAPGPTHVADALSEDLTLALARLPGATVISSASAFTYRDRPVDVKRLGSDLGVRYVVDGSVAANGDAFRISARLIDTQDAQLLWSDQFEVAPGELPRTEEAVVTRLANALDVETVRADVRRSAVMAPASLDAEDFAMQCDAAAAHQQGESGAPSYQLCERALQLDPNNVRALVRLALYYGDRVERMQTLDREADLSRARDWVARALQIDPNHYGAHCANAIVLGGERHVREAIAEAERCRALNPSHARAYRILATQHFFLGEPEQTLAYVEHGIRLSPRDPSMGSFLLFRGWAHLMLHQDDEALTWLRQASTASPDSPSILAPLISVLALTGHDEEARATLTRYLGLERTRARTIAQWKGQPDGNAAFERFAERFKSGLRRAGMAEG
ncbi:MAG: winged helix-turn-helix domain-containing protein [Caldimonas sp.]